MGSQMSWLELECVGDLETSQGSISTASLDSGYHPHWNLKQKGGRYLVSSTSGIANSWFSVLLSMYEDASGAQVPASSFSTSTCGDMLFWFFFFRGKRAAYQSNFFALFGLWTCRQGYFISNNNWGEKPKQPHTIFLCQRLIWWGFGVERVE